MTNREAFQKNFQQLFLEARINQGDFANIIGASRSTVSAWLTGRAYPRVDVMERIAQYFGTTVTALVSEQKIDLTTSESIMLDIYRQLSEDQKRKLIQTAITMLKGDHT